MTRGWSILIKEIEMTLLETALKYMEIFFSGENIDELRSLLTDDFKFEGPFYQFDTADDYIGSLKKDPPEKFGFEILHSFESESAVCLVYQFSKPGISTPMTQVFQFRENKICKIVLIFDSGIF